MATNNESLLNLAYLNLSETTSNKLTLSDISEKLIEEGIPPELLDNIYIHLDYSTLCNLNLTNEQWHSACKRFFIVPYDDKEDYHRLFLWWTNKTRKPFKIIKISKDPRYIYDYKYKLENHDYLIFIEGCRLVYYIEEINEERLKNIYKNVWDKSVILKTRKIIKITDDLPFHAYKYLTDVHKGAIKYEYKLTDKNIEELKIEIKTTHFITLLNTTTYENHKVEVYISYFYINNMRIKVIRTLVYNLPLDNTGYIDYRYMLVGNIFPYQLGEGYVLPSDINNRLVTAFYVPSMTTMSYNPELEYVNDHLVVHQNNPMFVQLRDILHKEITDRTLICGNYCGQH